MNQSLSDTPRVSVCMLAYNHAPYIREAIESVLMQRTDFPFEIIIGEDDSNDGTREICREYAQAHPDRIRLFLRDRSDAMHAMYPAAGRFNSIETVKAARGKYFALLECDDKWTDANKLQIQADYLDAHPECTICFSSACREYESAPENNDITVPPSGIKPQYDLEDFFENNQIVTCTAMYRCGFLDPIPEFFHHVPIGDWPLQIWHAVHGKAGYIDKPLGLYRVHDHGQGHKHRGKIPRTLLAIRVLESVRPGIPEASRDALDKVLIERRMRVALDLFNAGEYDQVCPQLAALRPDWSGLLWAQKRVIIRLQRKLFQHRILSAFMGRRVKKS